MSETAPPPEAAPAADPALPGRWLSAFLAWDALRAQLPDQPATYMAFVNALRQAGQTVQAEAVLGEAARRFYTNPELAAEHARAAEQRQDWPAALARWEHIRTLFPLLPAGHLRTGILLRKELGRAAEGEQVLEAAAARFPNRAEIWLEYAAAAADRQDRPAAILRYQIARDRFPTALRAWRASVQLLREDARFDEAEAVASEALIRFPDDAGLLQERAWIADNRLDWNAAALRWAALRTAHPDTRVAYRMNAAVLANALGQIDAADELLSGAALRFPDDTEIGMQHARMAERRGDLAEARQRWTSLAERFPGRADIATEAARVAASG